jgi:hypothetical protein
MAPSKTVAGDIRWWVDGPSDRVLEGLLTNPDCVLQGSGSVARPRAGRKRFYRLEAGTGAPALFVKIFSVPAGPARWRSALRPSKARREARIARQVGERGFTAAVPVAVGEERRWGLLSRSFSVIRECPARDLRAILGDPATARARRIELLASFGQLNRRLHDAGVDQDDTSPNNFLVDAELCWTLVDFERCRLGAPLGERRWTLLAKLHRHDLGVSHTERLRFLRSYLGEPGTPSQRREAVRKISSAFLEIRKRDARRAARGAFQEGRHVGREGASWFVRGREDLQTIRLELSPARARAGWIAAHQLERLNLPALRPVRLSERGLELQAPPPAERAGPRQAAVERALSRFAPLGEFVEEPQWDSTPNGVALRNPLAFRLKS